jgi:phytoene synthase
MIGNPTTVPSESVYAAADGLLARRGRSFHWARRLLSARHAEHATRLYGFCRRVDDIADEASDAAAAHAELAVIARALQRGESEDAATADMLRLMHASRIESAVPLELIRGVAGDLGAVRVVDSDELLHYCYQVAGTVGLMMTAALDVSTPEAMPHAIDLGMAMQLTNICRDVRDDALLGRRYLPASLVGALEPVELVDPTAAVRAKVIPALRELLNTADNHYASGERGLQYLPVGARTGILVAARTYRAIGTVLRKRDFDCWSSRAQVGSARKATITLQALATVIAGAVGVRPRASGRAPLAATPATLPRHPFAAIAAETGRAR